ncbi:MAG: fatty acid desaturase [Magnetospirillum sp.]
MIDAKFFEPDPVVYFRDHLVSMAVFVAAFVWGVQADWPWVIIPFALASAFLYRAGIFAHEIVHRPNHKRMRLFYWVWQVTTGAVIMLPSARFFGPHQAHHATGTFRTKDDPQYLLIRSNAKLAFFVLVVLPFLTPIYIFLQIIVASIGGLALEEALDRFTRRHFNFSVSTPLTDDKKAEVTWLSRYYLAAFIVFAMALPDAVPFYYGVLVAGWLLTVLRIPLEHELERYDETSTSRDQMLDSFSVETPLAVLIQPIGFRYHTAHHMYPGVPYHHLPAVHAHLKATIPEFNNSVVSYWTVIRGPKYPWPSSSQHS